VVEHVREQCRHYQQATVCFDPCFFMIPAQRLEAEGLTMVEWRQDNARMVPATTARRTF
jgi:hypothetical protein